MEILFICHITLENNPIKESFKFMGESSLQYLTSLTSLVTLGVLIVEIYTIFNLSQVLT